MSATKLPALPDPVAMAQELATLNDWRAILAIAMFLIVAQFGVIVALIVMMWKKDGSTLTTLNGVTSALWAVRTMLAEDRVLEREERALAAAERKAVGEQRAEERGRSEE